MVRGMDPVIAVVVEASGALTDMLAATLRGRTEIRLVGPVDGVEEACSTLGSLGRGVLVLDLDDEDAVDRVASARVHAPFVRVLGATSRPDPSKASAAVAAGACGLLSKSAEASVLEDAILRALGGELVMTDAQLGPVLEELHSEPYDGSVLASLTEREREVLVQFASGRSTVEVAMELGITIGTVQSHVKSVLAKLGVHSKVDAVRLAWRYGTAAIPA
jgi:two-component system nitrate/nitrite response regulator NarL